MNILETYYPELGVKLTVPSWLISACVGDRTKLQAYAQEEIGELLQAIGKSVRKSPKGKYMLAEEMTHVKIACTLILCDLGLTRDIHDPEINYDPNKDICEQNIVSTTLHDIGIYITRVYMGDRPSCIHLCLAIARINKIFEIIAEQYKIHDSILISHWVERISRFEERYRLYGNMLITGAEIAEIKRKAKRREHNRRNFEKSSKK